MLDNMHKPSNIFVIFRAIQENKDGEGETDPVHTIGTAVEASRCRPTYLSFHLAKENESKCDGSQKAGNIFAVQVKTARCSDSIYGFLF